MNKRGVILAEITSEDAAKAIKNCPIALLPIGGGAKAHGPHLPCGTDLVVVEELARRVVKASPVILLPALAYAYYPAFVDWPGSVSIEASHFTAMVADIIRSLERHGTKKFLILDGGVSTHCPLKILASDLHEELGVYVAVTNIIGLGIETENEIAEQPSGGHADEIETSCILAIRDNLVKMDRAVREFEKIMPGTRGNIGTTKVIVGHKLTTRTGINGDATLASVEKGKEVLAAMTEDILSFLRSFEKWPGCEGARNGFK